MRTRSTVAGLTALGLGLGATLAQAADLHHVHVTASNAAEAVRWYTRHLPCVPLADRDDGVDCAGTEVVFVARPTQGSSQRTGIDHIAFSFADLTAKMADLEAVGVGGAGVRLQRFDDGSTVRGLPGLFDHGFIFDPWGTRIELVEDTDHLGFHHIHLSATDPASTLDWYHQVFGGERGRLRSHLDGVRLSAVWIVATQHEDGMPATTAGRSIDHLAFEVTSLDEAVPEMRRNGVELIGEPAVPEGGRTAAKRVFVAGPNRVRLAVVETGFAGVDTERSVEAVTTAAEPYAVPTTPWGSPDLQGVWTADAADGTPLEPSADDAGKTELSVEEALARRERATLGSIWGYEAEWRDTTLGYVKSAPSRQVAMVVAPPSGRLPAITPEAAARMSALRDARPAIPEGPEDLSPWVRCITRGPIPMPQVYNNGLQIFQGPGHVVITREMVHETRLVPTEARSPTGADVTTYLGDPQGRWEGDTLVVELTNFNGQAPFLSSRIQGLLGSGYGSSDQLKLTERYTRTGPDTLLYEFTFDDPSVWTAPWTGRYTFVKDDTQYELVEYACHEGNYGMFNILTGARAQEQNDPSR